MNYKTIGGVAALALVTSATIVVAQSRDTIQIAGSSTVLPFASIVAEEFGNTFAQFDTPVVGSGGSSGGLRQFCEGVGEETIDIANSSRPIRESEIEACAAAGVTDIYEIQFGYDGIVFATGINQGDFAMESDYLFQAIAAEVPVDGEWVANPYTNWSQIDPSLPDQEIVLVIPATNHGTREVFDTQAVEPGCEELGGAEEQCTSFRTDGRVIEISGDYTETLARLQANPTAVGVFGLSFYEQNRDTLKVATFGDIEPTLDTIAAGEYPVSRPLFFYVKGAHIGVIPGIEEYVQFFLSDQMSGAGGILEEAGLVPQPASLTETELENFQNRVTVGNE